MNKTNHIPLTEDKKNKLENYFKNWESNEQEKEACVNYMFDNQEIINQAELEEKAISKIPLHLSRFLANEELLRANLNSFKNAKEMVKEWLDENEVKDYLEDVKEVEHILLELKREVVDSLKARIIGEIRTEIEKTR